MDKLFQQIEALQKKPPHVRQRILFITTGVLFSGIFFLWLSIFPATLSKVEHRSQTANAVSPFTALMGTIRETGKSFSGVGKKVEAQVRYVREQTAQIPTATGTPLEEGEKAIKSASSTATDTSPE